MAVDSGPWGLLSIVQGKTMNRYDEKQNYCRMLGHSVTFLYCRTTAQNIPCRKIKDCWFETLPIADYMDLHFSPEQQVQIFREPVPKVASILDLIEKARSREDQ